MGNTQFIQTTPEELSERIGETVNDKFEELRSTLQPPVEQILTREQTANLLQIDLSTLWHWTKKGKVKAYGIGNRVFYKRSEIEDALVPLNNA